ncbi:MAG TPA: ornithine cyclodeaminase family protein [Longimicrobiales bacterium]|nr:ornithine cyclodeaminase family protein [Longimicrobiales bacterium]
MKIRILSARDVAAAVDMPAAIEIMRGAFAALSAGDADVPIRLGIESAHGVHLFMPAHVRTTGDTGVKVVTVSPENRARGLPAIHAVVLVLDAETGRPVALMDGTHLTALRTGAAGGLAADLLARRDASVVALFGAGVQARAQLEAVRCVRPVREVRIVSRGGASAARLASELTGVEARAVDDPGEALRGAHVVITATDSARPVFPGGAVEEGAHVTAVGSYTPLMREVDTELVLRARVFVDQRAAALEEAGDLAGPIADGAVTEEVVVAELGEVASGAHAGRTSDAEITYFKSVGNAVQDVAVAARILEVAERRGLGATFDL